MPLRLPVADAGADLSARVGVAIAVDGSNSHGKTGVDRRPVRSRADDFITFQWTILQAPAGSAAAIDTPSPEPLFVADIPVPTSCSSSSPTRPGPGAFPARSR
jgi:hypothetical protein